MAFPTTSVLDNFNRTNGALGSSWSTMDSNDNWTINTNQIAPFTGAGNESADYYNVGTYGADTEVFATLTARPTNASSSFGLELRLSTPGGSKNGYHADFDHGTAGIYRVDSGAYTLLGATIAYTETAGDKYGFEVIGSTLKIYQNTGSSWVQKGTSRTDTTYSAAGYIGVHSYNQNSNETTRLDDFGGGTVSSGTAYTQSISGAMTPTGVVARLSSKFPSGTLPSSGVITKSSTKSAAGSLTPTGALVRQTAKFFTGALGLAGAVVTAVLKLVSVSGSLTPSGTLSKQPQKDLSGSLPSAGTLSRLTAKLFSGSLTPSGVVDKAIVFTLSLAGSLGMSGGLVRQINKSIVGGMTPSGALVRSIALLVSGVLTPAGDILKQTAKAFTGALGLAGTLAADKISGVIQVTVGGALLLSGTVSRNISKSVSGSLTFIGTLNKAITKTFSGILNMAGALARQSLNLPTPDARVYAINSEDRTLVINVEDRILAINSENRSLVLNVEDRTFAVIMEDRTYVINEG